ncbi:HPF/RaiA family ribosome-associated protein [Pelagicoccus enzymogenes]|uniref:HPF/RaiA family ribosome-associated protein n=1 Tax=Pelagicoccus enzymogenes TaxID=2773457 RepID=UPI00280F3427|nr:HPF/RaiA family ribosome-associated protein [Pelagicoccus enzymogenes]MDQ8198425.1 HPF/RaiA family ribosome-associated protein [Pelagicoccus enzymogenes]
MQILINTDRSLEGREALFAYIRKVVAHSLSHQSEHITRVEVHLADENGAHDGSKEMRCTMEARLEHHQPLAISHEAANIHQVVNGATEKLAQLVKRTLRKLREEKGHRTDPPPPSPETTAL